MSEILQVLLIGCLAAGLTMIGGLVAEFRHVPQRYVARLLQLAAGVLTALVAVTLMVPALNGGDPPIVITAFFLGGAAFVLMDFFSTKRIAAQESTANQLSPSLVVGILVDMLIDGVVIGISATMGLRAGLLLAVSIAISTAPLALATISLARTLGSTQRFRQVLFALFFACIVGGAMFGFVVLRNQSIELRLLLIAAAAGFLITTVTQSIIPEANRDGEPSLAGLYFVAGLSFYVLFSTVQFT